MIAATFCLLVFATFLAIAILTIVLKVTVMLTCIMLVASGIMFMVVLGDWHMVWKPMLTKKRNKR